MAYRVNTNLTSMTAQRTLAATTQRLGRNFAKLSSGQRITRAADDAAGLAISERLRAQISALRQSSRNTEDGISVVETAEGGLSQIQGILSRMKELATQSANEVNATSDKKALETEFMALKNEVTRIAESTEFNGKVLLDGSTTALTLQIGDGTTANVDTLDVSLYNVDDTSLSLAALHISAGGTASTAITKLDAAIETVSSHRASLGAAQNRLEYAIDNLGARVEHLSAAESRIRDVDFAKEMADFTRNQILQQAGTAMLAQANVSTQQALQLIG